MPAGQCGKPTVGRFLYDDARGWVDLCAQHFTVVTDAATQDQAVGHEAATPGGTCEYQTGA